MSYLHKLRKKPDSYKKAFAMVTSLSVTLVILLIWGVTKFYSISHVDVATTNESTSTSPFAVIKNQFANVMSSFKGGPADIGFPESLPVDTTTVDSSSDTTVETDSNDTYSTSSQDSEVTNNLVQ